MIPVCSKDGTVLFEIDEVKRGLLDAGALTYKGRVFCFQCTLRPGLCKFIEQDTVELSDSDFLSNGEVKYEPAILIHDENCIGTKYSYWRVTAWHLDKTCTLGTGQNPQEALDDARRRAAKR